MLNYTYLVTQEDLIEFGPNDVSKFRYAILLSLGDASKSLAKNEFTLIRFGLAKFMNDECLTVLSSQLNDAPADSFIKSFFHTIFENPREMESYIAIASMDEKLILSPVYHELIWDIEKGSRYPIYDKLTQCLEQLRSKLHYTSLADFPLPPLHPKQQSMVCPNGGEINALRKGAGEVDEVCEKKVPNKDGNGTFQLKPTTLRQAERYEPITTKKIEEIALRFNVSPATITLEDIVPEKSVLQGLRTQLAIEKEELAKQFGVPSEYFFDLLENADIIPANIMRFVHHNYRTLLKAQSKTLAFMDLIDSEETSNLASTSPPKTI